MKSVVIAPSLEGRDGISTVARETLSVLGPETKAWTLEVPGRWWRPRLALARRATTGLLAPRSVDLAVVLHLNLTSFAAPLQLRGTRVVVFLMGIEAWRPIAGVRAWALERADLLLAISETTAQRFRTANPHLRQPPVSVCPLGLPDLGGATAPSGGEGGFALIVGRLSAAERYKGHDELLEAWPRLLRTVPDASLWVAGDGDDRPRLEAKAQSLGLAERVRFLGRVDDLMLADLYARCAFFALPSRGEGFGLVYLEAMRAGRACLAAPGAAEEVLLPGETGLIVDPGDADQLCGALERLFLDGPLRERFGQAGRRRFLAEFTRERFAERLEVALGRP